MELEYDLEKGTCTLHQAALIKDLLSDNGLLGSTTPNPRLLPMDPMPSISLIPSLKSLSPRRSATTWLLWEAFYI
jgi:hypothetical protein